MKIFKKCIPSACESVYREIFVPHRETMRLSSKPWDLRGLLLDGGRLVPCSDKFMAFMAWHCIVMKILYESTRIKNKKYNEKLNNAMYKFGWVLDKYGGGGAGMYVPSLNLKYGHFPCWGVRHVPLPSWYLPMLQFHLALLVTTLFYKAFILQGETWCWSLLGLKG